ncbi:MAG TPA: hypothetical protein PKE59_14365, partial [Novosphingobium sp.]|nr:hypothetical protein [Novosphingobium sp.]
MAQAVFTTKVPFRTYALAGRLIWPARSAISFRQHCNAKRLEPDLSGPLSEWSHLFEKISAKSTGIGGQGGIRTHGELAPTAV